MRMHLQNGFLTHCVNNIHGQDSCDDEKWFDSLIDTTQKSSRWASKTLSCNWVKTFMMLHLNFCNTKFSEKIIKLSVCPKTDWGLESGPRPTLRDRGRTGVTGRLPAYGKHGNRIRSPGALNLIGASGYHSRNGNGTTPTPPAGHPTAPKTKTPKKMK